jgi:hypothetical protein
MKEWIKCAGIRAIKTIAQTAIATIGTAAEKSYSPSMYGLSYVCVFISGLIGRDCVCTVTPKSFECLFLK